MVIPIITRASSDSLEAVWFYSKTAWLLQCHVYVYISIEPHKFRLESMARITIKTHTHTQNQHTRETNGGCKRTACDIDQVQSILNHNRRLGSYPNPKLLTFKRPDSMNAGKTWVLKQAWDKKQVTPIGSMYGIFTYTYHQNQPFMQVDKPHESLILDSHVKILSLTPHLMVFCCSDNRMNLYSFVVQSVPKFDGCWRMWWTNQWVCILDAILIKLTRIETC